MDRPGSQVHNSLQVLEDVMGHELGGLFGMRSGQEDHKREPIARLALTPLGPWSTARPGGLHAAIEFAGTAWERRAGLRTA